MKNDDITREMEEMLKNARPLDEIDLEGLAEANRALGRDPKHVASIMKGVFVNDILSAVQEQGLNKSKLAKKWGKSRQYLNSVLDREKARNFTIDTIVSLSMTLGLRPQCIKLEPMAGVVAQATVTRETAQSMSEWLLGMDWCQDQECSCAEVPVAADESYDVAA